MAVYKRGKTWHYRFQYKGVDHSASTGLEANDANLPQARQAEFEARIRAKGGRPPLQRVSFMHAVESFLAWARTEYAPETARRLDISLRGAKAYWGGPMILADMTAGQVEDFKRWRRTAGSVAEVTLRHDLHALSKLLQYGRKHGWLDGDPLEGVDVPSDADSRRERILTPEEERAYFAAAAQMPGSALYDVGRLMILQGPRPAEVFALRAEHVNLDSAELHIVKSKSRAGRRTLPLLPESVSILAKRIEAARRGWLFPGRAKTDDHITRLTVSHSKAQAASGVDCRLYDLRHTFASRMAAAGVPMPTLARILGHGDLKTVMRYVHPQQEEARQAMQLMAATFQQQRTVQ